MKFYCLCMSPAIDATVRLDSAIKGDGEIFKNVVDEENAGGKGLNVARYLAHKGAKTFCGGLLGAENAAPFEREMAKYGVGDRFLRVPGATRRNEMITWPGGAVKLNRAAFPQLNECDANEILNTLAGRDECGVAIVSGSLPPCCNAAFYADVVKALKCRGFTVALDASGKAMSLALESQPDLIKPNADECKDLVGFVPKTPDEFARATAMLREKAAHVIISDGGNGAWFDGTFTPAPKVEVVDTTAAGDTLLAEYCYNVFELGAPPDEAARRAVAAGSAACTMPGGAIAMI